MSERLKTFLPKAIEVAATHAPIGGVFAFSACSVHAVAHMLFDAAKHDTPLYWIAAVLIELATAWLVTRIIERFREATRSIGRGFAKQDRRFAWGTLIMYVIFVVPSFITSVVANYIEFGGELLLALLFPVLTAACAAGAAMPGIIEERKRKKQKDKAAQDSDKAAQAGATLAQQKESWTQTLATLGKAAETLRKIAANPDWTRASIAQDLEMSPQAISGHLKKLESMGLIDRSNGRTKLPEGLAELLEVLS